MNLEQIREVSIEAVGRPQIVFHAAQHIVAKFASSGCGVFIRDQVMPDRWVLTVDPRWDFDSVLKAMLCYQDDTDRLPEWADTVEVVPSLPEAIPDTTQGFIAEFNQRMAKARQHAIDKGWWDAPRNDGELIALIHSELSEALESLRKGDPPDSHLPEFNGAVVELADAIIRIMDFAASRNWPLGEAIVAKMMYNITRPRKHGKEF